MQTYNEELLDLQQEVIDAQEDHLNDLNCIASATKDAIKSKERLEKAEEALYYLKNHKHA